MAEKNHIPQSADEIRDDLTALKLKLALLEQQEDELDQLEAESRDDPRLEDLVNQGEARMMKHIRRTFRQQTVKSALKTTLPRMAKVVAGLLLVGYLGLTIAVASNATVRHKLVEFFINAGEQSTAFGFVETGEEIEIPVEWQGYYYPARIPEGFTLQHARATEVLYQNDEGMRLSFTEMDASVVTTIDTENATQQFLLINEQNALLINKPGWACLVWNIDQRVMMIEATGVEVITDEELIRMARSVRMMK